MTELRGAVLVTDLLVFIAPSHSLIFRPMLKTWPGPGRRSARPALIRAEERGKVLPGPAGRLCPVFRPCRARRRSAGLRGFSFFGAFRFIRDPACLRAANPTKIAG